MKRKITGVALVAVLSTLSFLAQAQPTGKIPRIGYLTAAPLAGLATRTDAFRQGLRAIGYVEGKNIIVELRSSEGNVDGLPKLAADLVQLKVDVIVTGGTGATRAAKEATTTIPIVMAQDSDPIGNGFVASLARPGRNITGLSSLSTDLVGKRLELLKECVPKLALLAVMGTSSNPRNSREVKEIENIAATFGVKTQYLDLLSAKDFDTAFYAAVKARAEAILWIASGPISMANLKELAELPIKHRLPVIYDLPNYVDAGGLMRYGVNSVDLFRRAAKYVDKILKGAKPADLPVEQPTKFEFVVNLKTAKQVGLTIPPTVLARADKVIK
jgi:ABC-type uncharacterized transport system substrate-binding protein